MTTLALHSLHSFHYSPRVAAGALGATVGAAIVAAVAAALLLSAPPARADVLANRTLAHAAHAETFDTLHDAATGFVFVRLPQGWRFVGQDPAPAAHPVFHDATTDFVFVQMGERWRFAGAAGDAPVKAEAPKAADARLALNRAR